MGNALALLLAFGLGLVAGGLATWLYLARPRPIPSQAAPASPVRAGAAPSTASQGEQGTLPLADDSLKQVMDASRGLVEDLERRYRDAGRQPPTDPPAAEEGTTKRRRSRARPPRPSPD